MAADAQTATLHGGIYKGAAYKAVNSADVCSILTDMCNSIFGRDRLSVTGNTIAFDIPMSKVIVFAQGSNVTGVSANGMGVQSGEMPVHYNEVDIVDNYGVGKTPIIDYELTGVIATFENCEAGTYPFSAGSASNVEVYYEPDVTLMTQIQYEGDGEVFPADGLLPGDYTLTYALVDSDGNQVDSDLLGNISYSGYVQAGDEQISIPEGTATGMLPFTLEVGDNVDYEITANFLTAYSITKTGAEEGWDSASVILPELGELAVSVSGGKAAYKQSELEDGRFDVSVELNGRALSEQELDNLQLEVTVLDAHGVNAERIVCELEQREAAYNCSLS